MPKKSSEQQAQLAQKLAPYLADVFREHGAAVHVRAFMDKANREVAAASGRYGKAFANQSSFVQFCHQHLLVYCQMETHLKGLYQGSVFWPLNEDIPQRLLTDTAGAIDITPAMLPPPPASLKAAEQLQKFQRERYAIGEDGARPHFYIGSPGCGKTTAMLDDIAEYCGGEDANGAVFGLGAESILAIVGKRATRTQVEALLGAVAYYVPDMCAWSDVYDAMIEWIDEQAEKCEHARKEGEVLPIALLSLFDMQDVIKTALKRQKKYPRMADLFKKVREANIVVLMDGQSLVDGFNPDSRAMDCHFKVFFCRFGVKQIDRLYELWVGGQAGDSIPTKELFRRQFRYYCRKGGHCIAISDGIPHRHRANKERALKYRIGHMDIEVRSPDVTPVVWETPNLVCR